METKSNINLNEYDGLSPKVRQAAKHFDDKKNSPSFKNNDFNLKCIAFLTAEAEELTKTGIHEFFNFCLECKERKTNYIIQAVTDRYVSPIFRIDCEVLSFIGLQLGKCGFDDDAVRCFTRAEELITD